MPRFLRVSLPCKNVTISALLISIAVLALSACGNSESSDDANAKAVETSVAATIAAIPATATPLPPTSTPVPVADPFTNQWRDQNLKFVESIVTKLELVETTALAWANGTLSEDVAKRTMLTGITYAVDVLDYREFLLKGSQSNLRLTDDELNAIAALQDITSDDGKCANAFPILGDALKTPTSQDKPQVLRAFADEWRKTCLSTAQDSLDVLRRNR